MAKEAVKQDVKCGESWYVVGNAYVASFFRDSRAFKDLDRALQAYSQAVRRIPDPFLNKPDRQIPTTFRMI